MRKSLTLFGTATGRLYAALAVKRRLFGIALVLAAALATLAYSAASAANSYEGAPAGTCVSEGDSWIGGSYAQGQPDVSPEGGADEFHAGNSAVWQGGGGALRCGGFIVHKGGMAEPTLSFSLSVKTDGAGDGQDMVLDASRQQPFQVARRTMVEARAGSGQPSIDGLVGVYVSEDGDSWERVHVFDGNERSNRHPGGYVSVRLPARFVGHAGQLEVKFVGLKDGDIRQQVYLDSVFLAYKPVVPQRILLQTEGETGVTSGGQPIFARGSDALFRVSPQSSNAFGRLADRIGQLFGAEKDTGFKIKAIIKDTTGNAARAARPKVSWNGNEWDVRVRQAAAIKPGLHTLQVEVTDDEGNIRHIEQNFLWGVLALNTHKSVYAPGDTVDFDMSVLDEQGMMVCDAEVELKVEGPSSVTLTTAAGDIVVSDECDYLGVTDNPDYKASWQVPELLLGMHYGKYDVTLTAKTANGEYSITDSFTVDEPERFLVERAGHTRIMPLHLYTMEFLVTPEQDFEGTITETVPAGFELSNYSDVQEVAGGGEWLVKAKAGVRTDAAYGTQQISWQVRLEQGKTYRFSYDYDAPDVSPEFYLLGSLEFVSDDFEYSEPRQWQIASDAPDTPVLHNDDGGSTQIAFNNIRQHSTTPTFRASASNTSSFNRFQLELNTAPDFSGTSYTQTFSGTYSSGTPYNLEADNLSPSLPTTDGVTYNVRVRASDDSGSTWSPWSADDWSYTYKSADENPDWFQTTDAQFDTGTLSDTRTTGSGSVEIDSDGGGANEAVREFDGSDDDLRTSVGALSGFTHGTVAIILKRAAGSDGWDTFFGAHTSGGSGRMQIALNDGSPSWWNGSTIRSGGSMNANVWYLLVMRKGNGTVAPRHSLYNFSTGTWSHTGVSSLANSSAPGTNGTIRFDYETFGERFEGRVAVRAAWSNDLPWAASTAGDSQIEAAGLEDSLQNWADANPDALWAFNQATVGEGVDDLTGNGADEVSVTGTTVITNDMPPGFSFGTGATSGTIMSPAIDYDNMPDAGSWHQATWTSDETNGSISVKLYYTDSTTCDTVIPNNDLSGNESGFGSGPIDISGLNTTTYNEICLQATLQDDGGTPFLQDWGVSWKEVTPEAPVLHNTGGTTQIAFNNIRQNSTTPTFRVSASHISSFDRFQLEMNTAPDFSGTSYTQTFSGTYSSAAEYNLEADNLSPSLPTSDGATYYVRVRASADGGNAWSNWSGGNSPTWSYTYKSADETPDWFQTADAQFGGGTLTDTEVTGGGAVQLSEAQGSAAVERTGSVGTFNSTSNSGSQNITVPADADAVVVGVSGYEDDSNYFSGGVVTVGGDPLTVGASSDSDSGSQMSSLWYGLDPESGAQSLQWDWKGSSSVNEGATLWYAFYKGVDQDNPIRSSDGSSPGSSPTATAGPMAAEEGDAAVAVGGGTDSDAAWTNATELGDTIFNSNIGTFAEAFPDDDISITVGVSSSWATISAFVFRAGAAGASSGTITSAPVAFDFVPSGGTWNEVGWTSDETDGSISVKLYYTDSTTCDTVIPNNDLSGNESGFASGPIDISGLNTTTYNEICLQATLQDDGGTPFLQDWGVSWDASNAAPDAPSSLAQAEQGGPPVAADGWSDDGSIVFSAAVTDDDGDDVQLCVEVKPLGTPFTDTEDDCGPAVASGNTASVTIDVHTDINGDDEYHWQVRAKDDSGESNEYSSWVSFGGGVTKDFGIDVTEPTGGSVYDGDQIGVDLTFNDGSLSELSANWDSFDFDISGAADSPYEYSIGTSQGGTDVKDWTSVGTDTDATAAGLTLHTTEIYYFNVRATDNAGNQAVVSSDGQFVLPSLSFSASPASVTFGNLNAGNGYTDDSQSTTLTTSTNAYGGYAVRARATGMLETVGSDSIGWFDGGSYASPALWGSATGFGYTSSDTTIGAGEENKFDSDGSGGTLYAPFATVLPGDVVADHVNSVTGSEINAEEFTIDYRVTVDASQASGLYSTVLVYTVTAKY